jgi:hypothetical protein
MKILVCGGCDYSDYAALSAVLDTFPATEIIHGAARGADSQADRSAKERGTPVQVFPANWNRDGKAAGFIRNRHMLDTSKPALVVAFPGWRGTAHMVEYARSKGYEVHMVAKAA